MLRGFAKGLPIIFFVVILLLAIQDWLFPWPPGVQALQTFGPQLRVCIGVVAEGSSLGFGDSASPREQHSYLLIPHVLVSPSVVTVGIEASGAPVIRSSGGNLLFFGVIVALCGWLVWRWWVKPIRAGGREALRLAI